MSKQCRPMQYSNTSDTVDSIKSKLQKLKEDKAAGADNMSPRILKALCEEIAVPVNILFRKSLDTGCVPGDWRTANVSPLFKKVESIKLTIIDQSALRAKYVKS